MLDTEKTSHNVENELSNEAQHKLSPIQEEIFNAVTDVAKDQYVKEFIGNLFSEIAKERENGNKIGLRSGLRIFWNSVIANSNFWMSLWKHGNKIVLLVKCLAPQFFPEHDMAMKDPLLAAGLSKSKEINEFIADLTSHQADIEKAIAFLMSLPEKDNTTLLDQDFIKSILVYLEKNKEKITGQDLAEIGVLVVTRLKINLSKENNEATKKAKEASLNQINLKLASKGLSILSQFEGFKTLISNKTEYIGSLICAETINGVKDLISPEHAIKILEEILEDQTIQKSLLEGKFIVDELLKGPLNIMKVGAKEMRFAAKNFPETLKIVGKSPELVLLQLFDSEEKDNKIKYTINTLGKQMIEMGIIKLPVDLSIENFKVFIPVGSAKEVFDSEVLSKIDTKFVKDFLPVVTNPEILKRLANVTEDLGNDMPLFTYLPKILEITQNHSNFGTVLSKHAKQIEEITKIAAEQQGAMKTNLTKFGLTPKFLEITSRILDSNSLQKLYKISVALGSDNNDDMTTEAIKWLKENKDLIDFLRDPNQQREIANLVKACGDQANIAVVVEYFNRPEFKTLKEVIDKGLIDILPTIMSFLTSTFLETLEKVMDNGTIVNGFSTLECFTNVQDRAKAEDVLKQLYFYLIDGSEWSDEKIQDTFKIFGIKNKVTLDSLIVKAKINYAGIKVRNEINGIFKADLPENPEIAVEERAKYEAHVAEIKAKQLSERGIVFEIISKSQTLEEALNALKNATNEGKLSDGNYRLLADRLNKISLEEAKLVFERILYEDRIRQIETLGFTTNAGITLNELSWEVIDQLSKEVNKLGEVATTQELVEIINDFDTLSQNQQKILVNACLGGKDEISKNDLYNIIRDGACRLKGGEGVGEIQTMLSSLLAPIVKVMKMPYGLNLHEISKITNEIKKSSFDSNDLKNIITRNSKTTEIDQLINHLLGDSKDISQEELHRKFIQFSLEYNSTMSFMNKFMVAFNSNPILSDALLQITWKKGDFSAINSQLFARELLSLISTLDPQERQAFNKVIPEILNGLNLDPYLIAAIKKVITDLDNTKLTGLIEIFIDNKTNKDRAIAALKATWNNLGNIAEAGLDWFKGKIMVGSQETVTQLAKELQNAREKHQKLDVRGFLSRNSNGLVGLKIKGDFTSAIFEGMNFHKSSFEEDSFANASFIKCNFSDANLGNFHLKGGSFDFISFESFVSAAEKKNLDVSKLLEGAEVKTSLSRNPIDAKLAYALQKYCEVTGMPFNQEILRYAQKLSIRYSDLELLTGNGWKLVKTAIGVREIPLLSEIGVAQSNILSSQIFSSVIFLDAETQATKTLNEQLAKKGLTKDLLNKYLDEIKGGAIKEKSIENPLEHLESLAVKGAFSRVDSKPEKRVLQELEKVYNLTPESQNIIGKLLLEVFPSGFKPILGVGFIHEEMPRLLNVLAEKADQIDKLRPEQRKELGEVLSINRQLLPEQLAQKIRHYLDIALSPNYSKIASIVKSLGKSGQEKFVLYSELVQKSADEVDSYISLLQSFVPQGKLENADVPVVLKNWYLERAFSTMQSEEARDSKLSSLECLDQAILYQDLSNKEKFFNIEEENDIDPTDLAAKISKEVMNKLSGDRYLTFADRTSELRVIFAVTKAIVDKLSEDDLSKLQGVTQQVVERVLKNLEPVLRKEKTAITNSYIVAGSNVEDLISNTIEKGGLVENIIKSNPSHNKKRDELYNLSKEELRTLNGLDLTIQAAILDYSNRSDRTISEMLGHKDILGNLEKLSKKFEVRYKLAGEKDPEKFCLNLVIKLYNDMPEEVRVFFADPELHWALLGIGFNAIQEEKINTNSFEQIEALSATIVRKINPEIHTPDLAKTAIEQGKKIAEEVFTKLNVQNYLKGKTAESQDNFAFMIASRLLVNGQLIEEGNLLKVIGEVKPAVGYFSSKQSTGLVKAFLDTFGTITSYEEVKEFDPNHRTQKIFEIIDTSNSIPHIQAR